MGETITTVLCSLLTRSAFSFMLFAHHKTVAPAALLLRCLYILTVQTTAFSSKQKALSHSHQGHKCRAARPHYLSGGARTQFQSAAPGDAAVLPPGPRPRRRYALYGHRQGHRRDMYQMLGLRVHPGIPRGGESQHFPLPAK